MPSTFSLIGTAWKYYRSQPVLNSVLLWLLALPLACMLTVGGIQEKYPEFMMNGSVWMPVTLVFFVQIALSIIMLWGIACTVLVGRKLVQNKAGRTRSSFAAVRKEASRYVTPLFLTNILRDCMSLLWGLLLVVPGVIYAIRTFFYFIVIVDEDIGYRSALRRSADIVKGQTWRTFWAVFQLTFFIFGPAFLLTIFIGFLQEAGGGAIVPLTVAALALLWGACILLFTLASMPLYATLKKLSNFLPVS